MRASTERAWFRRRRNAASIARGFVPGSGIGSDPRRIRTGPRISKLSERYSGSTGLPAIYPPRTRVEIIRRVRSGDTKGEKMANWRKKLAALAALGAIAGLAVGIPAASA